MVGNKEVYGFGFKYLDYADIANVSYPTDVCSLHGSNTVMPLACQRPYRSRAKGRFQRRTGFPNRLQSLVTEVNQRREAIKRIEQQDIGRINAKMDALRLQQRALERAQQPGTSVPAAQLQPLQKAMAALQAEYEVLARRASDCAPAERPCADVSTHTGEERRLALGQIVHVSFPEPARYLAASGVILA